MNIKNIKKLDLYNLYILFTKYIFLLFIFSISMSILGGYNILTGLIFAIFQLCMILLPGFCILLLLKLDISSNIEWFSLSYLMGFCFDLFLYFIIVPFQTQKYAIIYAAVIVIVCIMIVIKKGLCTNYNYICEQDLRGEIFCSFFIIILLCIETFAYACENLLPLKIEDNALYHDVLYWIGNTIELKREFPPKDFRNYPNIYNYHYFSSIQLALESIVTEIRPIVLSLSFEFIQPITMIVTGAYLLFRRFTSKGWYIGFGLFALLFNSGFETVAIVTYVEHMYVGPFGFDYGMGCFLFLLYFLVRQYQKPRFDEKLSILSILLVGITTGTKASFGAIGILGAGVLCILWLINKKYKKAFINGIFMLIVFLLIYFCVTNPIGYAGSLSNTLSYDKIYEVGTIINKIYLWLNEHFNQKWMVNFFFYFIYSFLSNPCIFFLEILVTIRLFPYHNKIDGLSIAFYVMVIVGTLLTIHVGMPGLSNMYFIMATYPVAIALALKNSGRTNSHIIIKILTLFFCILSWVGWMRGYDVSILDHMKNGWNNCFNSYEIVENNMLDRGYINKSQYQAYCFLKDTDEMMITTNRENRVVGVVTEKYVIIDEDSQKLFLTLNGDEQSAIINRMKEKGILYIVHDKVTNPDFQMRSGLCEIFFENTSTCIYKIK